MKTDVPVGTASHLKLILRSSVSSRKRLDTCEASNIQSCLRLVCHLLAKVRRGNTLECMEQATPPSVPSPLSKIFRSLFSSGDRQNKRSDKQTPQAKLLGRDCWTQPKPGRSAIKPSVDENNRKFACRVPARASQFRTHKRRRRRKYNCLFFSLFSTRKKGHWKMLPLAHKAETRVQQLLQNSRPFQVQQTLAKQRKSFATRNNTPAG